MKFGVTSKNVIELFYITSVVLLFCIGFSEHITGTTVDIASHYSLVDKIDRDFFINQGYIENLGEMSGYPPGAHYAAAAVNLVTNSGLVSMNVINLLALALGWIVIAKIIMDESILALFYLTAMILFISMSSTNMPLFGLEVVGGNYLYGQFVSTGFFIGLGYFIYKFNGSMLSRLAFSLLGFYIGIHIHASFALGYFAGSFFYFLCDCCFGTEKINFSIRRTALIFVYGAIGSLLFYTDFYTKFATAIRKHNGSLGFSLFSNGAEDVAAMTYVIIFGSMFFTVLGLVLYRVNSSFRNRFGNSFTFINSLLLGLSFIAAIQVILLHLGEVAPYVVKKNLFGIFTFSIVLISIYISSLTKHYSIFQWDNSFLQSDITKVALSPLLFVLLALFNWSKSQIDLTSVVSAQKVARAYLHQSEGDVSYRNTIAQFSKLSMPMNWLITVSELQVYKWSPLSTVVVHQTPNDLPKSAFVLTEKKNHGAIDNGLLKGEFRVYSARNYLLPAKARYGQTVFLTIANPDSVRYLGKGFSKPEVWGVWAAEDDVHLRFVLERVSSPVVSVTLSVRPWLAVGHDKFVATASVGGVNIAKREFLNPQTSVWTFDVPTKFGDSKGEIDILFTFDNPSSPKLLGISEDARKLSLGFESFTVNHK